MKSFSKITVLRLIASGAIVGVAVGNLFGLNLHILPPDVVSGALGATAAAVALKLVHIL